MIARRHITLATLLICLGLGSSASADPISVFGTGLDDSGAPLAGTAADPHYAILETGTQAVVLNNNISLYFPNNANSQWLWETSSGRPAFVTRTFRTTFNLTGFDPSTASLTGRWGADNIGVDVLLNGTSTGISLPDGTTTDNFASLHEFNIGSGFQPGVNTLDFVVQDIGGRAAFRTELSGTANPATTTAPTPEPSSILLFALGGLGLLAHRRGGRSA